jgi:hypothetical protein
VGHLLLTFLWFYLTFSQLVEADHHEAVPDYSTDEAPCEQEDLPFDNSHDAEFDTDTDSASDDGVGLNEEEVITE